MFIILKMVKEGTAGPGWQEFFLRVWPYYHDWFVSEGTHMRAGYTTSRSALETHMPELLPTYDRLCELAGGGDLEARFLSMWCPPPYLAACSQLAWTKGDPTLVRNYDYNPRFFDGKLLYSNWLRPVIGMLDSTWGLLDGMNADGLAASLSFGGRKVVGEGFGIPLVLRYVLETCTTVEEACAALSRIPVHMTYNVTVMDRKGDYATVYLAPDRPPQVLHDPVGTNHQHVVEWDEYGTFTHTLARKRYLEDAIAAPKMDLNGIMKCFLAPPLYQQQYFRSFGTLYGAAYNVKKGTVTLFWPEKRTTNGFKNYKERELHVHLLRPVGRFLAK